MCTKSYVYYYYLLLLLLLIINALSLQYSLDDAFFNSILFILNTFI